MSAMIARRGFLAGTVAFGLMPRLGWASTSAKWPNVQALLDRYVAQKQFAGASAALSAGGAPVDYINAGTLAFDSSVAADENTLWRLFSMTKPVTAAAAMILIEEGRMGLDQPVGEVLPALKAMKVATDLKTSLDAQPARNPITMRHLLTHTAGLSYQFQPDGSSPRPISRAASPRGPMARWRGTRPVRGRATWRR